MAAYSPYELLRVLIERIGWPTETDKRAALESVDEMERMSIFGNLATMMECPHPVLHKGSCTECGKWVTAAIG